MVAFNKVFSPVFLAIVYASVIYASTDRVHVPRDVKVEGFHPPSIFKAFGSSGIDHPLSKRSDASFPEKACSFIASELGFDLKQVAYRAGLDGEIVSHAYLSQTHDGVPFANAVANVAMRNNKIVSYGSSFVSYSSIAPSTPSIAAEDAISTAEEILGGKYDNREPALNYVVKEDYSAVLTHAVQIRNDTGHTWYKAYVDAHSGKLVSAVDYVAQATYLAVPVQNKSIEAGQVLIVDPENPSASPSGWTDDGNTTSGNNVYASKKTSKPPGLGFEFKVDLTTDPGNGANVDAARTNAFYVVNSMHDITYLYGFNETAFNFQKNNFGLGGAEKDPVSVSVQDYRGINNAYFATPPDGQSGSMYLLLFDRTNPFRDSALENDLLIHEFTHGVTNRMTGGGTASCLGTKEAKGLGEGWSDAMADWVSSTPGIEDFVFIPYLFNKSAGARSHPYSTDAKINPLRYSDLKKLKEVHGIGEVWANMLHNVLAALVDAHGFSTTAKTDPTGTEGNVVFLHLFLDALQLQPCNPDFLSARDAWYQADALRYDSANKCTLQTVFASRGLGLNAQDHNDDDTVDACEVSDLVL